MKKSLWFLIALVIILGAVGMWYSYRKQIEHRNSAVPTSASLHVAATIYPLYDIVRTVGGDTVQADVIVPPGASPHTFSFSPREVGKLQDVPVVFAIGNGLDQWISEVTAVNPATRVVTVDKNITLRPFVEPMHDEEDAEEGGSEGPFDPHYFLSMSNAAIIAHTVANTLAALDPAHATNYTSRAEAFAKQARAYKEEFSRELAPFAGSSIITLHDAWGYFAEEFNLHIVGSFEPRAGEEPTPRYLERMVQAVKDNQVHVVFSEPQLSSAALESFAHDNNVAIAQLDPEGGIAGRDTFFVQMRYNVDTLAAALQSYEK